MNVIFYVRLQAGRWPVFLPGRRRGTKPSSSTKGTDSFRAPPFNLFAPFHRNDVLVVQGEGGVIQLRERGSYRSGGGVLTPHHRALGNHLVGGLCDTFYQFFMPSLLMWPHSGPFMPLTALRRKTCCRSDSMKSGTKTPRERRRGPLRHAVLRSRLALDTNRC